jgi:hypothetical protein
VARRGMAACVGRRRRSIDSGRQKGVPPPPGGPVGPTRPKARKEFF